MKTTYLQWITLSASIPSYCFVCTQANSGSVYSRSKWCDMKFDRQKATICIDCCQNLSHRIYRKSGNGIYWSHKTELYPDELWQKRETNHEKPVVYWCVNFRTNCNSKRRAFLEILLIFLTKREKPWERGCLYFSGSCTNESLFIHINFLYNRTLVFFVIAM